MNRAPIRARIRRGVSGDAAALFELEAHFDSDRMSLRTARRMLRVGTARVWVAEMPDAAGARQVVGALTLLLRRHTSVARIYSVVIASAARGQGLAQRLMQRAEAEARALGSAWMGLEVSVDNAPARALYEKRGYRTVEQLPGYYEDGGDGVRMRKPL